MKRIFALAAMFALPASVGFAAIDTDGLISRFQGDGYTTIEVTRGINETKVEAIRNNEKVEVVYDNATGAVLETEFGTPDADDDIRPGDIAVQCFLDAAPEHMRFSEIFGVCRRGSEVPLDSEDGLEAVRNEASRHAPTTREQVDHR